MTPGESREVEAGAGAEGDVGEEDAGEEAGEVQKGVPDVRAGDSPPTAELYMSAHIDLQPFTSTDTATPATPATQTTPAPGASGSSDNSAGAVSSDTSAGAPGSSDGAAKQMSANDEEKLLDQLLAKVCMHSHPFLYRPRYGIYFYFGERDKILPNLITIAVFLSVLKNACSWVAIQEILTILSKINAKQLI